MSDQTPPSPSVTPDPDDVEAAELSEFEQSFFNAIQSRFPVSEGTGPEADHPHEQPVSAGEEAPVEGQEAPSPDISQGTPEGGEAPGTETGQSAPVFTLSGGQQLSEDQIVQALQVHNYFARLTPQQVQGIDALMSGQYRLAPASATEQPQPQTVQPVASSSQTPSSPPSDEGEWLDPRAQQEVRRLQAELNQLKQGVVESLTPVINRQQDDDYQARLNTINSVSDAFQQHYALDDQTMRGLEQAIVDSQVLPQLQHRYGSLQGGMAAALEMFMWSTPQLREAQSGKQSATQEANQQAIDAATLRKQQLTALSASGGSAPRREPVPSTPEDRHEAMKAEIAQAMNGSGTIQ